jgi:hypothetical protein
MKYLIKFFIIYLCIGIAKGDDSDIENHPDAIFMSALSKIEDDYINNMRSLSGNAVEVIIYQLDKPIFGVSPFENISEDKYFLVHELQQQNAYKILRKVSIKNDTEGIERWALAVLPAESFILSLSKINNEFGVRFIDTEGSKIYETLLTLKGRYTTINFPRYSDRSGVDVDSIKKMLLEHGFDIE